MSRIGPLLVALAFLAAVYLLWPRPPERTLYVGGEILTMDEENPVVEALLVEGQRIQAVGSRAELEQRHRRGVEVVDLAGKALLPGFIDAHGHFPGEGILAIHVDLNSPPIGDLGDIDELVERLRARADETAEGEWVVGMGYDDTQLAEKRHPTRADLDGASTRHPIVIAHISGHLASTNSLGLQVLEIDADTADPEGGRIRRDPETGEPDGVLEEEAMMDVMDRVARPSLWQGLTMAREATRRYLENGVTTAQSGYTAADLLTGLNWLSRLGLVPLRMVLWPDSAVTDGRLDGSYELPETDQDWVRIGATKLVADGSIQGYTGYLSQPYHVPPGDDPSYRGYPRIEREELIERVGRYHAAGLQVAVHGNGDASIDDILDAFEQAQRANPRSDARHVVIHAQMAREDQLARMRELGVIPSFFSLHTYYWGDRHRDIFMGPERAARMSPARSAAQLELRFTIHADSPVVPMEPLRLVWAAVNRRSASGAAIGEAQRITPIQALRAVTIDAAYQHFEEDEKGSLEAGKLADLVVLSRSPLEHPETIDQIEVIETVIGGRSVFRAEEAGGR